MVRWKDRDDEAKGRFLTKAVVGTEWGLKVLQRTLADPPYQRIIGAPYTLLREIDTFQAKRSDPKIKLSRERFRTL